MPATSPSALLALSLMPATGDSEVVDFHRIVADLREHRPVAPVNFHGQTAFLLTRHEDVLEGFRMEETFNLREMHKVATFPTMGENIMGMEGEQHRIHRELVSLPFRARTVSEFLEDTLRPLCLGIIDEFDGDGEADLMEQFARRLPVAAIARLLGLPEHPDLEKWALAFITYQWDPVNSLESAKAFTGFLRDVVEERRRNPGDDMISRLFAAQIDGEALDDETLLTFVRLLFPTGADTTYLGVGSMLYALVKHPEVVAQLRDSQPARVQFVEETLRWESPVGAMPRICVEDTVFHGESIPAGAYVLLGITCANRDPAVFANPDQFDFERDSRRHLTFGLGRHFCLGAPLARAEMLVSLECILERFDHLELQSEPRFVGTLMRGPDRLDVGFRTRKSGQ
jgi:cytochrome P450